MSVFIEITTHKYESTMDKEL